MAMKEHDEGLQQSVSDQAAEWFIRLRDRDLTMADRRKFVRWLKQAPSHIAEFMRLCQLYGRVKRAKVPTLLPDDVASNVIPLMQRGLAPSEEAAERLRTFVPRRFMVLAAACCLALIGVIGYMALSSNTIETRIGEWRRVQLADGSRLSVGPNTLLRVEFSDGFRRVHLQRGETMFEVSKDASRPFIVDAAGVFARAVGTRFGVDHTDDSVRVTVAEGKVAVVQGGQAPLLERDVDLRVATALEKDEGVEIALNAPAIPLRKEKVDALTELAWASGQLSLQQETVAEAVREFNRRNRLQIVIEDAGVADLHLCCIFDASDPETFARTIVGASEDVELVRTGDTLRIVSRRAGSAEPPAPGKPF
jgi:transmembrane sensor